MGDREWWQTAEAAAARLRADSGEWADYLTEVDAWDTISSDGLQDTACDWPEFNPEPSR